VNWPRRKLGAEQKKRADDQAKAAARQRRLTMATLVVSLLAVVAAMYSLVQKGAATRAASGAAVAGSNAVVASQRAITNEQVANRQLAEANWLVAQGARAALIPPARNPPSKQFTTFCVLPGHLPPRKTNRRHTTLCWRPSVLARPYFVRWSTMAPSRLLRVAMGSAS